MTVMTIITIYAGMILPSPVALVAAEVSTILAVEKQSLLQVSNKTSNNNALDNDNDNNKTVIILLLQMQIISRFIMLYWG